TSVRNAAQVQDINTGGYVGGINDIAGPEISLGCFNPKFVILDHVVNAALLPDHATRLLEGPCDSINVFRGIEPCLIFDQEYFFERHVDWKTVDELSIDTHLEAGVVNVFKFLCLLDRKSTRLNSSHVKISYAVFCLKKKKI